MSNINVKKEGEISVISFSSETLESMQGIVLLDFSVKPGENVSEGQKLLITESMKGTMELESPISGVVEEINLNAAEDTDAISEETWLLKIK